jgi:hypothetical protein
MVKELLGAGGAAGVAPGGFGREFGSVLGMG